MNNEREFVSEIVGEYYPFRIVVLRQVFDDEYEIGPRYGNMTAYAERRVIFGTQSTLRIAQEICEELDLSVRAHLATEFGKVAPFDKHRYPTISDSINKEPGYDIGTPSLIIEGEVLESRRPVDVRREVVSLAQKLCLAFEQKQVDVFLRNDWTRLTLREGS